MWSNLLIIVTQQGFHRSNSHVCCTCIAYTCCFHPGELFVCCTWYSRTYPPLEQHCFVKVSKHASLPIFNRCSITVSSWCWVSLVDKSLTNSTCSWPLLRVLLPCCLMAAASHVCLASTVPTSLTPHLPTFIVPLRSGKQLWISLLGKCSSSCH